MIAAAPPTIPVPPVTVSSSWATVEAGLGSFCWMAPPRGTCGDGPAPEFNPATPVLHVTPGSRVTITPGVGYTSLGGTVGRSSRHALATFSMAPPATYRLGLPKTLPPVSYLVLFGRFDTPAATGDGSHALKLVVPPTARPSKVRLTADRVVWTVSCPRVTGESCAGRSTLRTHGRIVARASFKGLKAGARRTLSVAVGPEARRLLRSAPVDLVVVRTDGRVPAVRAVQRHVPGAA